MDVPSPPACQFAYQPILNADQAAVAIRLVYRDDVKADVAEAAAIINSAFLHPGLGDLLRNRLAHVRIPAELLDTDLLGLLPAQRFVLEFRGLDGNDVRLRERLEALKARGFTLALGRYDEAAAGLLPLIDIVCFDHPNASDGHLPPNLPLLQTLPVKLMANEVTRREDFDYLRHAGFHLFQGYYFARPHLVDDNRADPSKLAVLDLLSKLDEDVDDRVLEDTFKRDPRLTLHLLRLVNSSAFALHTEIRSLKHAFAILGRGELTRWLRVLLFALDGEPGEPSPLMELALRRAYFMEFVLKYRTHHESTQLQDVAYFVGLLSLADALMGWPLEKIAERLHLSEGTKAALLSRQGLLGRLIDLCEKLEAADFDGVEAIAAELHLPMEGVNYAQSMALALAAGLKGLGDGWSEDSGQQQEGGGEQPAGEEGQGG